MLGDSSTSAAVDGTLQQPAFALRSTSEATVRTGNPQDDNDRRHQQQQQHRPRHHSSSLRYADDHLDNNRDNNATSNHNDDEDNNNEEDEDEDALLHRPLLESNTSTSSTATTTNATNTNTATTNTRRSIPVKGRVRSRKAAGTTATQERRKRRRPRTALHHHHNDNTNNNNNPDNTHSSNNSNTASDRKLHSHNPCVSACLRACCRNTTATAVRSTVKLMNLVARALLWCTTAALAAAVFWYSYELLNHGTDPHLIAWFSAGAFVLLGFPISMWGIVSHLANYNQPHVQVYIVRILWMVPIYSVESWLAMRFHKHAIYIETLRDLYESYVLYSFLQFLIQVLGGEQALILMLKDKSPTRGVHMWGLQWCVKPWLMGQPVRKTVSAAAAVASGGSGTNSGTINSINNTRATKRVHWKSPFFVKCKFGVLQYVLLKFVSAVAVLILEFKGWYKEGDFTPKGGYLYICIVTNVSQCWALYCLIFFYFATHTELSPIRPVGKFLSVKALVFFTWWQSVVIAILYNMDMIPHYQVTTGNQEWSAADVAKGIQDYLICMEMFVAAVVHSFVFPHAEYAPQAVQARARALNQTPMLKGWHKKRLGRSKYYHHHFYGSSGGSSSGGGAHSEEGSRTSDVEMVTLDSGSAAETWDDLPPRSISTERDDRADSGSLVSMHSWEQDDDLMRPLEPVVDNDEEDEETDADYAGQDDGDEETDAGQADDDDYEDDDDNDDDEDLEVVTVNSKRPGFVRALLDSAIPRDLRDNTVGIVKGDYTVERKTLLHHATTSDNYDLFSPNRRPYHKREQPGP